MELGVYGDSVERFKQLVEQKGGLREKLERGESEEDIRKMIHDLRQIGESIQRLISRMETQGGRS